MVHIIYYKEKHHCSYSRSPQFRPEVASKGAHTESIAANKCGIEEADDLTA